MYSTLLFDFDGTLVPSLELWLQAFQYAVSQYGRDIPEQTIIDRFYYRDYVDVCAEFGFPSGEELRDHVHDGLTIAFTSAELFEGVKDLLAKARSTGKRVGLVTSSPRMQVESVLSRVGIDKAFDTIVTGDDVVNFKPHPEPVLMALSNLDARADETLFVGDYVFDVLAGRAAGTTTALFLPDRHARFYDFDKLRATEPDLVFHNYHALASHLDLR
jgi:pyrophosphatase PpaX